MNIPKESDKSYVDLIQLNRNLEERLAEEVARNRQLDLFLIQQSKRAAMGEMIANVGHQWRQPLNNLTLLIQDLRDALEFGEMSERYIDRFTRESMSHIQDMTSTLNEFRKFYRPNKEKSNFSVSDAIEDALALFAPCLKNHDIHIEFIHRGQHMALGFPNRYSQAVLNILQIARDSFVHQGEQNRNIQINIFEESHFWAAQFTYNAGGVGPTSLLSIFDPTFTTKNQGTGLGHYLTKTIMESMNGTVKAENNGDGTSIILCVPKAAVDNI